MAPRYRILFVCMGNICRSPIAEAVTRGIAQREGLATVFELDSAGTHGHYHAGEAPDARARRVAAKRGYDLSRMRARSVVDADFVRFDRILAMDETNLSLLRRQCAEETARGSACFLTTLADSGSPRCPTRTTVPSRVLNACSTSASWRQLVFWRPTSAES